VVEVVEGVFTTLISGQVHRNLIVIALLPTFATNSGLFLLRSMANVISKCSRGNYRIEG